jgi:endoglucanase
MKQLLRELVETPGVSGDEHRIREKIKEKVVDHSDTVKEDDFGNLIARKGEGEKSLMIMAHMDQIGVSVRRITEDGYIKISKVGGMFETGVINQRFSIHSSESGEISAIAAAKPPHLMKGEDQSIREVPKMKQLFLDVGAEEEEDVKDMGIRVGDYVSYERKLSELGNDYVTGPAFDDRVGCTVLIEALKAFDGDYEFIAVFSAQEEVGTKGAKTSTFSVDPDVALALDTGMAGDVPGIEPDESNDSTGDGIGIDMVQAGGRGLISPEKIRNWLIETAENEDHTYFRSLYDGGATDAASIQLQRDGVPTGSLSVPTRHIHSPVEVVKMSDLEIAVDFIEDSFQTMEDYF